VIDVATRGRKRGLALVAATQRLSKLHKDVAAELLNKLIGRTGLDVDVKRAADELGMTAREAVSVLRDLQPGEFYAFGPALTRTVTRVKIGRVLSTHPKVGDRLAIKTPAPSQKVRALLQALGDLPREAETEALTLDELRAENTGLKRQLAAARIAAAVDAATQGYHQHLREIVRLAEQGLTAKQERPRPALAKPTKASVPDRPASPPLQGGMTQPQQRILDAMARLEALGLTQLHKTQVAAFAGVSPTSGSFANNLGRLRTLGLIDYPQPGSVAFTNAGQRRARPVATPPTVSDLHQAWLEIVTGPQARILREVVAIYPQPIAKEALAKRLDVSPESGSYANNLGRLRTLGVIDYPRRGYVRAKDVLFPVAAVV
jgi:Mn-dependent DtxR family transcriptional regulator